MLVSDLPADKYPNLKFTKNRIGFGYLLQAGIILGVVAGSETGSCINPTQIQGLHIASVVIFLYLTVLQALRTATLAFTSVSGGRK